MTEADRPGPPEYERKRQRRKSNQQRAASHRVECFQRRHETKDAAELFVLELTELPQIKEARCKGNGHGRVRNKGEQHVQREPNTAELQLLRRGRNAQRE